MWVSSSNLEKERRGYNEEIDEIINKDYTNEEIFKHVLKTYIDKEREKQSYWLLKSCIKKKICITKNEKLVKKQ